MGASDVTNQSLCTLCSNSLIGKKGQLGAGMWAGGGRWSQLSLWINTSDNATVQTLPYFHMTTTHSFNAFRFTENLSACMALAICFHGRCFELWADETHCSHHLLQVCSFNQRLYQYIVHHASHTQLQVTLDALSYHFLCWSFYLTWFKETFGLGAQMFLGV